MGNRAVITTKETWENNGIGIYLHWNGGRDSIESFLEYCRLKGYRSPECDPSYAMARLVQVIANFFGGSTSIGINSVHNLDCDNGDNGVYIIGGDWQIVGREYHKGLEQQEYDRNEFLRGIDEAMPVNEQLGAYLSGNSVPTSEIKIGDKVAVMDWDSRVVIAKVIGIGKDEFVNGTNVNGIPYTNQYTSGKGDCAFNINNYLLGDTYRIVNPT